MLVCPIVMYYDLLSHASHMIDVHYPIFTQKLQYWYDIGKKYCKPHPLSLQDTPTMLSF